MARLLVNKRVWIVDKYENIPYVVGPFVVTSFKQFLPAGPTKHGERKLSLVQFHSDAGLRTASVASIWSRDPNKNSKPW